MIRYLTAQAVARLIEDLTGLWSDRHGRLLLLYGLFVVGLLVGLSIWDAA